MSSSVLEQMMALPSQTDRSAESRTCPAGGESFAGAVGDGGRVDRRRRVVWGVLPLEHVGRCEEERHENPGVDVPVVSKDKPAEPKPVPVLTPNKPIDPPPAVIKMGSERNQPARVDPGRRRPTRRRRRIRAQNPARSRRTRNSGTNPGSIPGTNPSPAPSPSGTPGTAPAPGGGSRSTRGR